MTDPYETLGLEPGASAEDIETAYRLLRRQSHPDGMVDATDEERHAAERRLQEITYAYAVLTDPAEAARFERLQSKRSPRGAGSAPPRAAGTSNVRFSTDDAVRDRGPQPTTSEPARAWRTRPQPTELTIREYRGWRGAHWLYVHAPGGRAGKMNVTTGEVTIEREELREQVLLALQHHAFDRW